MGRIRRTDDLTADRLLAGRVDPDDAPAGYAGAARVLAAAAEPHVPSDPSPTLLTAMAAAASSPARPLSRRSPVLDKLLTLKVGVAVVGALALTGGTAAAATGNLPDAAQDRVASIVEHVGVDLPDSGNATSDAVHKAQADTPPGPERGKAVSDAAHKANAERKAAHDATDDTATDDTTDESGDHMSDTGKQKSEAGKAKAADNKARAQQNRADHQPDTDAPDAADDSTVESDSQPADPGVQGSEHATDPTTKAPEQGDDGIANRP